MAKEQVTIDVSQLPEGMTAEKLIELVKSAEARAETGEKQRKVRSYAVQKLEKAHEAEYKSYREEAIKKFEAGQL